MKKAVFNWSGGKDSALALQKVLEEKEFEVISLLTTMNAETSKSSMHAVPLEILERQADSVGIPLYTVVSSTKLKNYDSTMSEAVHHFKVLGVNHFIFGDIFLSDVKARIAKANFNLWELKL
jgi:diphthamide synthase (EF-2-diphthine--ammonia ligase)